MYVSTAARCEGNKIFRNAYERKRRTTQEETLPTLQEIDLSNALWC